jgi:hypothetical protein
MPDTAATLIAGAMGQGYAGLSARQCMMCLLAIYANGLRADQAITGAMSEGYSGLSDRQLDQCLLKTLQA